MSEKKESLAEYCHRINDCHLLDEWDYEKNAPLTPETVSYKSNKKYWWRCSEGHEWQAYIYNRTGPQKTGCPVCAGQFKKRK